MKRRFFLQAAVNGNREAAFHAGVMCRKGLGGEKLLERAQELFLESKMGGEAHYEIGLVNQELGLPAAAIEYFRLAAAEQHEGAKSELEKLGVSDKISSRKSIGQSSSTKSDGGSPSGRSALNRPDPLLVKRTWSNTRGLYRLEDDNKVDGPSLPRVSRSRG